MGDLSELLQFITVNTTKEFLNGIIDETINMYVYRVTSIQKQKRTGISLGEIRFHSLINSYTFYPYADNYFSVEDMIEINLFISRLKKK